MVQRNSKISDSVGLPSVDLRAAVVEWKFSELDTNGDQVVDRQELDRLGMLVRKLVRPTSCAVSFDARCDVDFDSRLTLHEWKSCFDDDGRTSQSTVDGSAVSVCPVCLLINHPPFEGWLHHGQSPFFSATALISPSMDNSTP